MVNKKIADTQKEICSPGEYHNTDQAKTPEADFPIIGIGASAGGLEALELFLGNVPEKCGVAFVVVQHLDPTREGIMVELLKRATVMPVFRPRSTLLSSPTASILSRQTRTCPSSTGCYTFSTWRCPAVFVCQSISFFDLWPMTGRNGASQ